MVWNFKSILYLLMLFSGGVLAVQCILLLAVIGPITVMGIGTLSQGMVSWILIEIIMVCAILSVFSILCLRPGFALDPVKKISPLLFPFLGGSIFCIEGIASINLSSAIVSGISSSFTILIGIQLFCLGIISISAFVAAKGNSYLVRYVPNYFVLIFFLLLIPPAFLIGN